MEKKEQLKIDCHTMYHEYIPANVMLVLNAFRGYDRRLEIHTGDSARFDIVKSTLENEDISADYSVDTGMICVQHT